MKTTSSEVTAGAFPRNNWECTQENASRVDSWLRGWYEQQSHSFAFRSREVDLVDLGDDIAKGIPAEQEARATVELQPDAIAVNHRVVEAQIQPDEGVDRRRLVDELSTALERRSRELEMLGVEKDPGSVHLVISPEVPVKRVLAVLLVAAQAGIDRIGIVIAAPQPSADIEPIPEDLADRLARLIPTRTDLAPRRLAQFGPSAEFVEAHEEAVEDCPQIVDMYHQMERIAPRQRWEVLTQNLGNAWFACECSADIEFVLGQRIWPYHAVPRATVRSFAPGEARQALEPHKAKSWGEAAAHVIE